MKQLLLVIAIFSIPIIGLSQNSSSNVSNFNNSFVDEKNSFAELKVYPNPCKLKKLTIEYNSKEIAEIELTNIAGKKVLSKQLQFPTNKYQINLDNTPNGIYLLRIKTTDSKLLVKKVLVSSN